MITVTPVDFPIEKQEEIRQWLTKPESEKVERIAEAQAKSHAINALNEVMGNESQEKVLAASSVELRESAEWTIFLKKLTELRSGKIPLATIRMN